MNTRKRVGIVAESYADSSTSQGSSVHIHREFAPGFQKYLKASDEPQLLSTGRPEDFHHFFDKPSAPAWAAIVASILLIRDLRLAGWDIENTWDDGVLALKFVRGEVVEKDDQRLIMAPRRRQVLLARKQWIRQIESEIVPQLADGSEILLNAVKPELHVCVTKSQHAVWRYCRMLASIPHTQHVGRRIRFLIRDASLPNQPVMAIAGIGSSLLQIKCRDDWIGWNGIHRREEKLARMQSTMDLYAAVAVPPYSHLLAGKLVVYMMASNEVRSIHDRKYASGHSSGTDSRLVLMTTTSAFTAGSSIYNRIRFDGQLLLQRIGETLGYGTLHLQQDTIDAMIRVLETEPSLTSRSLGHWRTGTLLIARRCIHRLGFDPRYILDHGHTRPVYVLPLAENARSYLCGETDVAEYFDWGIDGLVDHWIKRWLRMRIEKEVIREQIDTFRKNSILLSNEL